MALELQLSTDKAQSALDRIERSLDSLRLSLDRVASGASSFDAFTSRLAGFRGISPAAVSSVKELGNAAAAMSGGANFAALSNAIGKLSQLDVTQAAVGVRTMVSALNSVRVPPALGAIATEISKIAVGAQTATSSLRMMSAAMNLRMPSLGSVSTQLGQVGTSARSASGSLALFGSTATNVKQALTALGIGALGREFGQFVTAAYQAQVAFDKFNAIINNAAGPETAGAAFKFIQALAKETATDVGTLTNAFPRFLQTLKTAGATAPEIGNAFRKVTTAFRGFGLSAEESKGAMNAIIQMFQKGKVSAEELRQQLGDRGVPAMNAFAQAMGVTVPQLDKMVESGKLGAAEVMKFIDTLHSLSAGAVVDQMTKIEAKMTLMANAFTNFKLAFGAGFFSAITAGIISLTNALQSPVVLQFANAIGYLAGLIGSVLLSAVSSMVQALALVAAPIIMLIDGIYQLGVALAQTALGVFIGELLQIGAVSQILSSTLSFLVGAVGVAVVGWGLYRAATLAVTVATAAASAAMAAYRVVLGSVAAVSAVTTLAMSPLALTILGIAAAALVAVEAYRKLRGETSLLVVASEGVVAMFGSVQQSAEALAQKLTFTGTQAADAGNGITTVGVAAEDTTAKLKALNVSNKRTADGFGEVALKADTAAGAIERVSSAGSGSGGGGTSQSAWQVNSKWGFGDYAEGRAIDREFFKNDFGTSGLFSRAGGLSTGGSNGQVYKRVDSSLFAGAPRFAQGGTTTGMSGSLPDGGIPSILHPNEAVVPLDAGGKIPVQQSGGNSAALIVALGREFGKADAILQEINKGVATVKENVNAVGVVIKTESDRHLAELQAHQRLLGELGKAMGQVVSAVQQAMTSTASGSSGVGGSVGSVGGTAPAGTGGLMNSYYDGSVLPQIAAKTRGGIPTVTGTGTQNVIPGMVTKTRGVNVGTASYDGSSGSGSTSVLPTYASKGFATGSPNAFRDIMRGGAAPAIIHPDEAIVPLPDGRRVPVEIRGQELAHRNQPVREGIGFTPISKQNQSSGSAPRVTVVMNLNVKDASSFRNSEDQITQRLVQQIDRATRNLGAPSSVDDPTRPSALTAK